MVTIIPTWQQSCGQTPIYSINSPKIDMIEVRLKYSLVFALTFGVFRVAIADPSIPPVEFAETLEIARGPVCADKPFVYLTADAFGTKPAKKPYGIYLCTTRVLTGEDADWISQIKSIGADVSLQMVASPSRPLN
jgi:hypothetical protein